ncbi:MAG: hypothetical protein M3M94_07305, partial [Actinomycetota bacterium]|nr:hypothetical protein [Actinomycetota bacterium]
MDERRLAALRRWAAETPVDPERAEVSAAARVALAAAEGADSVVPVGAGEARAWARRAASRAESPDVRSAARTILAVLADVPAKEMRSQRDDTPRVPAPQRDDRPRVPARQRDGTPRLPARQRHDTPRLPAPRRPQRE